jgi:hypothetical protein
MSTPLRPLLSGFEDLLLDLECRQYALEAFKLDLERVTQGKEFRIWNDIVWLVLLDSRDMNIVHLASWAKSVYETGGLIGRLRANHMGSFSRAQQRDGRDVPGHEEAFKRLFYCTCESTATPVAWVALREEFERQTKSIVDARHSLAHSHEKKHGKGSATMLERADLRATLDYAEKFMNDLSLVGFGRTMMVYGDMNAADATAVAEDLVDSLLLFPVRRQELFREKEQRDAYYADLRRRHDEHAEGSGQFFNDAFP